MNTKKLSVCIGLLIAAGCSSGSSNPGMPTGGAGGTSAAGAAGNGATAGTAGGGTGGSSNDGGHGGATSLGVGGDIAGVGGSGGSAGVGGNSAGTGGNSAGAGGSSVGGHGGSTGGTAGGGAGGGSAGSSGHGGASGGTGGSSARWTCPSGPFTAPNPSSVTLTKVAGVPPFDSFNNNGNNFGIIEGPVWFGDALYVSEIGGGNNPPPSRILRVPTTGSVSIAFANSGTNGLAIDQNGGLIGASHGVGGIVAFNLTSMTSTPIVSQYMSNRFDSPNDLTVRSDGTIYFSDPDYQAPSPRPQSTTRLYRLPPGASTPVVVDMSRSQPNGVTLSLDETNLYVTDSGGIYRYPVNADGSTGTATRIAMNDVTTGDGMAIDCMGNLYIASNQQLIVVNPAGTGTKIGAITVSGVQQVSNAAFGGANHQTLYVTGLGNGMGGSAMGVYKADLPLPGMPY